MKKRPVHLTLFATRRCNARCPFCFHHAARDAEESAPELSLAEIRRVAASMGPLLWVLFSGGEPFLRDDLVEVSGVVHDVNGAAFLTIPTNGLLPEVVAERTREIVERCPGSVVVVKVSLDGVGAAHDRLRQVPGAFARAMATLDRLVPIAERHPRLEIGVNTLFCSDNQFRMCEIVDFVRTLDGVRAHTITMVRGELADPRYRQVDLGLYERAVDHLERSWSSGRSSFHRFAGARLKAAQDRVQRQLVRRTIEHRRRLVPCYAGRLSLVLGETGELYPCEGLPERPFGNVRESGYDVGRLLGSRRGASILDDIASGTCWCSHECNLLTNILFNPRLHPAVLREYARLTWGRPAPERQRMETSA